MSRSMAAMKRSLLVKLGVLLCILAGILIYSNHAVNGLIHSGFVACASS